MINEENVFDEKRGFLLFNEANVTLATNFIFLKWCERATDRGLSEPVDLSNACKFASIFANVVFGGELNGNWEHQYVVNNTEIIDLTNNFNGNRVDASVYKHDEQFWGNDEHVASLVSCIPRVNDWINEFVEELSFNDILLNGLASNKIEFNSLKRKVKK